MTYIVPVLWGIDIVGISFVKACDCAWQRPNIVMHRRAVKREKPGDEIKGVSCPECARWFRRDA